MSTGKNRFWRVALVPVIGFIIGEFISYLLSHFLDSIKFYEKLVSFSSNNVLRRFFELSVPVWKLIVIMLTIVVVSFNYFRKRISFKNQPTIKKTKQQQVYDLIDEFKKKYRYVKLDQHEVKFRTNIGLANDRIILEQSCEPYCLRHGEPVKMKLDQNLGYFECIESSCSNIVWGDMQYQNAKILSKLEKEWEEQFDKIKV